MVSMTRLAFTPAIAERLRASALRVAITGASGWLGQATLEMLEQALGDDFAERVCAFGSRARTIAMRSGRKIEILPLTDLASLASNATLLLHYAFLTKEWTASLDSAEYFGRSEAIAHTLADAIAAVGAEKLLFPSSGAVYGLPTRTDRSTREDPEANPYGTQKLRDERRFSTLCGTHGVRLSIPRIFSLSGPFINKHDSYALASIINYTLSGAPVQLRARWRVVRSYIAIRDLLDTSIGWLLASREPRRIVFDTGGEAVEVGELARKVLRVLGREDLPILRPEPGPEPDDIYLGEGTQFEELARQQGVALAPLEQQISDTAAYLRGLQ
jgi:nucleoside-diphosphate-sugar epimerase